MKVVCRCISLISVYIYENNKNFEITNDKEFIDQEESVDKYFDNEIENFSTDRVSEFNTYSQNSIISKENEDISDSSINSDIFNCKPKEEMAFISLKCIFQGCHSLKSLPDISKWNTRNVIDMK